MSEVVVNAFHITGVCLKGFLFYSVSALINVHWFSLHSLLIRTSCGRKRLLIDFQLVRKFRPSGVKMAAGKKFWTVIMWYHSFLGNTLVSCNT